MSTTAAEGASRPSRRLLLSAIAAWAALAIALPLAALTLNIVTFAAFPLGFWIAAQGALAGLAVVAIIFSVRARGLAREGWLPPMALAGEALGAASIIGLTGAIAALGFDGLALPLGLAAGLALMAIVIAPRFVLYPVRSLGGFFAARFGGVWPRRIALIVAAVATVFLLAANLRAAALALQGALEADYATAATGSAVAVGLVWAVSSHLKARPPLGAIFATLLIGFAVAVTAFAIQQGSWPTSYFAYGDEMRDLAALEQKLVVAKLSDVRALRPMASPFLQLSMSNFLGFVLALAFGVAALPHLLGRHASQAAVAPGDASRRAAFATAWAALLLIGLGAYAVFARLGVAGFIARGLETAVLPRQLLDAHLLRWLEICGVASPGDVAAACAKASGQRGFLRLQDVAFSSDAFVIAAPSLSGLPTAAVFPLWIAVIFASIAAGSAMVSGVLDADGEARSRGGVEAHVRDARSLVIAVMMLLAAAAIAVAGQIEIPGLISDGLALIAASLFPALTMGLYWRRVTPAGACAAMLTGFVVVAGYIAGVRLFPAAMFEWTGALSDAAPGAIRKFEQLRLELIAAANLHERAAASLALHRQAGSIVYWGGLRPAAFVIVALPLAVAAGIGVSLLAGRSAKSAA